MVQQSFRSAFNGFNREDVVRYIEYLNNQHKNQIAQLNTELDELRTQLAQAQENAAVSPNADLELRLEQAENRCAALEAELAEANAMLEEAVNAQDAAAQVRSDAELEAYRRAERAERLARERAEQLYAQANGALAEATTLVDQAAAQVGSMANELAGQMNAFRDTVIGTKSVLADAAASLYAIRPCGEDVKN